MPGIEFFRDISKIAVITLPLIYFLVKGSEVIVKDKRLVLLVCGFFIMLFGGIMDFTDEFATLNNVFLLGAKFPHHETLEDVFGIIGFVLFALGIAVEINYIKNENIEKGKIVRQLEEQAKRLKKFDALKSKFIEDVSHEFRSPLSSIGISLNSVIDGLIGEVTGKQKEILENGKKHIMRLSRLVADLLTLSQIESGKMKMQRKENNVSELIEEAYLALKPLFEKKNIAFNKVSYVENPIIWCDSDRIIEVFMNIISNGVKYSPPNTEINARILGEENKIRVEIEDQGKGMSEEDLRKLFSRFERLDAEKEDETGLGLVIAKEIMELHQAKIQVQSRPQKGTCFILLFDRDLRK